MLEVQIAVAKVPSAGMAESGDTLELIERPGGGFSCVLVDGQGSGRGAKTLSNLVITRAIAQIKDGAHDGVVARAAHDYLYTYRMGQVAATLNIVSVDFASGNIWVTRNNPAPFFVLGPSGLRSFNEPSQPIGLQASTRPLISEIAAEPYTWVVVFSDDLLKAGTRHGVDMELENVLGGWRVDDAGGPQALVDTLLRRALELDHGEPSDDMSILAVSVLPSAAQHDVRRLAASFALQPPLP